jgi:predicted DNA-binding transcriptional regulator YafY
MDIPLIAPPRGIRSSGAPILGGVMQRFTSQYTRRIQRLLVLVNEVKTNLRQQPEALYAALGISRAMFYKDRQALATLGFTFRYNRSQHQYVITQDQFLPVLNLSTSEVLALIMAVRQLSSTGDYTLTYDAIAALRKVISNTPAELRAFFQTSLDDVVLQEGFGCNATILQDLWCACQKHERLRMVHDRGDSPQEWVIDPYQIFFKRRALYLDACVVTERQVKMFRINRIKSVTPLGVRLPMPLVPYNFRERHRHSFSVFVGEQVQRVRIRFRSEVRQYITETRWHASQQIDDLPNGSFIFQVDVSQPREVGWWALQWGASAEVLEPESLRLEMRETARRLVEVYGT